MFRSRSRSKDRNRQVTPPGPVYMSNEQFATYLSDLRTTRISRPNGARPQPSSNERDSDRYATEVPQAQAESAVPYMEAGPRSSSAMSHRRNQSSLSMHSVASRHGRQLVQKPYSANEERPLLKPSEIVPSATYMERGQRWMEKEEAVSLRDAMEDLDIKREEEKRLHAAAQNEASELVWQHQNPGETVQPHAPYRYNSHLRKNSYQHARTQSIGRYGGIGMATGLARDIAPRSVSGDSSSSGGMQSQRSRVSSGSSGHSRTEAKSSSDQATRVSRDMSPEGPASPAVSKSKSYGSITSRPSGSSLRRSSAKRNISGEVIGSFTGEQIWEEPDAEKDGPEQPTEAQGEDMPAPLRCKTRNPLNRVQFAPDLPRANSTPPEMTKKISLFEIHRNPPTQTRNPAYTANSIPALNDPHLPAPEKVTKEGMEIRSDEIRQATSMRLKDRSPKLPTPSMVSDRPGRPIVSFDANWKPKQADEDPGERRQSRFPPSRTSASQKSQDQDTYSRSNPKNVTPSVPSIHFPDSTPSKIEKTASIPIINLPDSTPSIPMINLPDSTPPVPTINISETPTISVSSFDQPTINVSEPEPTSSRPLPDPRNAARKPASRPPAPISRGHWSLAGKRATATCHQCQIPIEGRVVGLRGAPEKFHPHCFICHTCGTGLEALEVFDEPPPKRIERLGRIRRRNEGEVIPEIEGQTMADDGNERLRYFCHLDWHELYAPKCKHCQTPILGEHTIALGEHWHFGHFFCAECGDPFEKGMSHIEKDGYAWCVSCQTKRTERRAPKCMKCKLPVIGQVVQALGGEWHDKCFRCTTCKGDFPDGCFFPKQTGGGTTITCTKCMEIELKA